MVFLEHFELGFLGLFFTFLNPYLTVPMYVFLIAGFITELLLLKKCVRLFQRTIPLIVGIICSTVCECLWHTITGWDRLALDVIYMFVVSFVIGISFAFIYFFLFVKDSEKHS